MNLAVQSTPSPATRSGDYIHICVCCCSCLPHTLTHTHTPSLTHSLTHTHSFTYSLIHSFIHLHTHTSIQTYICYWLRYSSCWSPWGQTARAARETLLAYFLPPPFSFLYVYHLSTLSCSLFLLHPFVFSYLLVYEFCYFLLLYTFFSCFLCETAAIYAYLIYSTWPRLLCPPIVLLWATSLKSAQRLHVLLDRSFSFYLQQLDCLLFSSKHIARRTHCSSSENPLLSSLILSFPH